MFCWHGVFNLLRERKDRKIISFLLLKLGYGQSEWLCLNSFVLILYLSFILFCFLKGRFQINSQCFNWRFLGQKISLYYYNFLWFNSWDNKNFSLMKCQFCYGDPWGCLRTFTWNFFSTWTPSVPVSGGGGWQGQSSAPSLASVALPSFLVVLGEDPSELSRWVTGDLSGKDNRRDGGDAQRGETCHQIDHPSCPIGVTSHTSAGTRPFLKCERLDCI